MAVFDLGTGIEEVEKEVIVGDNSAVPRPLGRGAGAGAATLGVGGFAAFATAAAAIAAALAAGAAAAAGGATGALAAALVAFVFVGLDSILGSAFTAAFFRVALITGAAGFGAGFAFAVAALEATAGAGLAAFGGALGLLGRFALAAGFAASFTAGFALVAGFAPTFAFGAAFADDGLDAGFFAAALLLFALVAMSRRTLSLNFFASRCIAAALGTRSLDRFACQTAHANRLNAAGGGL